MGNGKWKMEMGNAEMLNAEMVSGQWSMVICHLVIRHFIISSFHFVQSKNAAKHQTSNIEIEKLKIEKI